MVALGVIINPKLKPQHEPVSVPVNLFRLELSSTSGTFSVVPLAGPSNRNNGK